MNAFDDLDDPSEVPEFPAIPPRSQLYSLEPMGCWPGAISQNVCENKRRETCPRITTIFALRRAQSGRTRQTRFGGKRRGGHILSKLHKIWLNQYREPGE